MSPPLVLLGEAYGENEARIGAGFVGASGIELLRMLDESGIITLSETDYAYLRQFYSKSDPVMIDMIWKLHPEVHRTNVFNLHPPGNKLEAFCGPKAQALPGYPPLLKGKHIRREFQSELDRLGEELISINPNLIICLGNSALWALRGQTGISKLRGTTMVSTHCVSGFKLLPTYHPAAVLRQWELRPVTVVDLIKAQREQGFPEVRRTPREIWIEPTIADLEAFYEQHITRAICLSVDIETAGNQITCIGFSPTPQTSLVIPFHDSRRKGRSYWPDARTEHDAWIFVRRILESPRPGKVFQNGLYDIAFLWRSYGIRVLGAEHDTMLLHHALQPESLKSLGFLGSIYTNESAWKTERKRNATIKRDE